jgi:hypothetical protein
MYTDRIPEVAPKTETEYPQHPRGEMLEKSLIGGKGRD